MHSKNALWEPVFMSGIYIGLACENLSSAFKHSHLENSQPLFHIYCLSVHAMPDKETNCRTYASLKTLVQRRGYRYPGFVISDQKRAIGSQTLGLSTGERFTTTTTATSELFLFFLSIHNMKFMQL